MKPGIDPNCPLLPKVPPHKPGRCDSCSRRLPPRRRRWCSNHCATRIYTAIARQHEWTSARAAAVKRDKYRCRRCRVTQSQLVLGCTCHTYGTCQHQLEVNHIEPRNGQGYGKGCHHHLDNLETLCHNCHVVETKRQRNMRIAASKNA